MQLVPMKNMQPMAQDTATTCWLTCLKMLLQWKEADYSTEAIRTKLVGTGILWDDACSTGLKTRDYMRAAKALGLHPWGCGTSWSPSDFGKWLTMGPVWVAGRWSTDYSHNVVVIGASDEQIKYIDPWWEGVKEATVTTRSADWFIHGDRKTAPGTDFYLGKIGAIMNFASFRDV